MRGTAVLCLLALGGCATAPAWLVVAAPALGYLASINNAGSETLKFIDDEKLIVPAAAPACSVWQAQILPLPETLSRVNP